MTRTGFAPAGTASLSYWANGDGPAALFLHAGVADSRMWRAQIGLQGFHTIAFDQRGFGKTKWLPEPYANRTDALAVLDHLGVEQAAVVGCSNGGEAAMQLAIVAPERVSALVLVGTAARGWEPEGGWEEDPLWEETVAAFKAGEFDKVVDFEAHTWLAGPGRSLDDMDPELVGLFREMDRGPQENESERDQHVQTLEPPTNEQLDQIEAPTLVIVGEHDFPDLIESAHYLAGRLSDRPAVILEDTAHLPSLERPERFNQVLTGFLAS
ncbi:MAG: alpha/beta hydrolase [Actinobacteria bacterium]|nr:alpha/beta hydrolase [Actinomycetota bacterium]